MAEDDAPAPVPLETIPLHSTNLLTVLDETGVIHYESPAIERIFGFDQAELIGEPVAAYFHPADRERVVDAYRRVVESAGEAVEAVEYRHARADGSYRWVESVAAANPTPGGHYVVNTRDIADQKARERELEATNDRLDRFAAVVSHDLRSPLAVATGRLELARADADSDHLDDVAAALDRMEALIDDLLALARGGTAVEAIEPVDFGELAESCWRTVSTADASLEIDTDRAILADRSRLRQLLENLMRNAVEHGGEGITVTVGELPDEAGFYVADTGPGIPTDRRMQVFQSGFSTAEAGAGLGLAIVEEIVDAHGWDVRVTDSAAGGARFEIVGVDFATGRRA